MSNESWEKELDQKWGAQAEERRTALEEKMWEGMPNPDASSPLSQTTKIILAVGAMILIGSLVIWGVYESSRKANQQDYSSPKEGK